MIGISRSLIFDFDEPTEERERDLLVTLSDELIGRGAQFANIQLHREVESVEPVVPWEEFTAKHLVSGEAHYRQLFCSHKVTLYLSYEKLEAKDENLPRHS